MNWFRDFSLVAKVEALELEFLDSNHPSLVFFSRWRYKFFDKNMIHQASNVQYRGGA